MFNLKIPRLPYREDALFSTLGFTIFIIPLVFCLYTYENFETAKFSLFLVLTGASLLLFLKRQTKNKLAVRYSTVFIWLLLSCLAFAVLSTTGSIDKIYSLFGFYYRFTSSLVFYFIYFIFLFLLFQVLDENRYVFLLKTLTFTSLLIAIISCLESLGIGYYAGLIVDGFIRPPGLLGNPDFTGMFLVTALPFVVYLFQKCRSFYGRVYYALCGVFTVLASLVLASRGSLVALAVGMIFAVIMLAVYTQKRKVLFGLLILSSLAVIFGGLFLSVSRPLAISAALNESDANVTLRVYAWEVSLKGLAEYPLLGSGPGTFALTFERNRPSLLAGDTGVFDDAHNLFLQLAVTTGLPFALLFFSLIFYAGFRGIKQFRQTKDYLVLSGLTALVIWTVAVCFNPVVVSMYILLALILAGLLFPYSEEHLVSFISWQKITAGCIAVFFIAAGLCLLTGEYVFSFADRAYLNENYSEAYKLSNLALHINPTNQLYYAYKAGSEIYLDKNLTMVVRDINNTRSLHPLQAASYAEISNLYDILYQQTGNKIYLQIAILNLQKSLAIDPFYPDRYGQMALYFYLLDDLGQAQRDLNYDLDFESSSFPSWILMAKIYQSENQRSSTINVLEQALKIMPGSNQLRYILEIASHTKDIKSLPIQLFVPRPDLG
jgi:O-antigen ligase